LSSQNIFRASMTCLLLFQSMELWALSLARARAGNNSAANMAMMAITTNNSMSVKPRMTLVSSILPTVVFFIIWKIQTLSLNRMLA